MVAVMHAMRTACLVCAALYTHVSCYTAASPPRAPLLPPLPLQPPAVLARAMAPIVAASMPRRPQPRLRRAAAARMSLATDAQEASSSPLPALSCPTPEASTLDLFRFILPTLTGWLSSEVMTVIDTAVVGSLGADQLAALSPATMLTDSSSYLFFWLSVATTSLFASALAENDNEKAYDVLSDALWCGGHCARHRPPAHVGSRQPAPAGGGS